MDSEFSNNDIRSQWSDAARDGLVLSLVSLAMMAVAGLLSSNIVSNICWFVKLTGSLYLLRFLMFRFGKNHPGTATFGYGVKVCLFSSIICAIFAFFVYAYLTPDAAGAIVNQMRDLMASSPSADNSDLLNDYLNLIEESYPRLACISTFIQAFLSGLIFSGLFSRTTTFTEDNTTF